ncbi:hypothetical protein SAMN05421813_104180 [Daejeonella rubra]|uniref:Uncharacterized protein n=1 Tax=Daejeonella rubra TaxID=990371 RepID=A0A1G9PMN7_9SPHI|nr:hypothetical protein SAMN05421813_104180 [Daejeonella rubra]
MCHNKVESLYLTMRYLGLNQNLNRLYYLVKRPADASQQVFLS